MHFYDFTTLVSMRKLVRLLEVTDGDDVPIEFCCDARPDYGARAATWKQTLEEPFAFFCGEATLFTNIPIGANLHRRFTAEPGKLYFAVLDYSPTPRPPDTGLIRRWLQVTGKFWEEWNLFNYYRGPHENLVRRSAMTLKLLTYAPTGAFVAAPTTSLPERIGGSLNWDYRYVWVRDTALFINTMFRIGYSGEAKAYFQFIAKRCNECMDGLDVLLPIGGGDAGGERCLAYLAGYRGSRPVRIGNRAAHQAQLDNYGHLMQALYYFCTTGGKRDRDKTKLAERLIHSLGDHWDKPDNGIWESLEEKHYTIGKVMSWVACQRGRDLLGDPGPSALADAIRDDVLRRGMRRTQARRFLAASYEEDAVDASSLLAFTTGFLPVDLARSTREEIERRLGCGGPFLYRTEKSKRAEGAFLLCSFWLINHLIQEGETDRAEELLEAIISSASPLGLLAEEIDPASGEFLGNFPQAFSHLGLIGSILNLQEAKQKPHLQTLPDHEKFRRTVGTTIGVKGVLAGFIRVPKTFRLLFSRHSKWSNK